MVDRCADPRYHAFEVLYCARYHGVGRGWATGAASPRLGRSMQLMHAMELRTWLYQSARVESGSELSRLENYLLIPNKLQKVLHVQAFFHNTLNMEDIGKVTVGLSRCMKHFLLWFIWLPIFFCILKFYWIVLIL